MKDNKTMTVGIIAVLVVLALVAFYALQKTSSVSSAAEQKVNAATEEANSQLDKQLAQDTSGISDQDVLNFLGTTP